nr:variable surface lipoprotein [Mycoplasmopsis bovis]
MNKKKLILIRGGVLFASSLPLIAASCKNNETKEPKKEPEMDTPIAPTHSKLQTITTDPEKTDPNQNGEAKVIKTDISKLKLQTNLTNNTTKKEILELLKKQDKLGNLTESDFDFKLEKKSLLNRKGEISITSKSKSKLISGTLLLTIDHLQEVTPRKHKYSADKTEVLEIGYNKYGQIEQFDRNVKKVPKVLPEEVISKDF